MEKELTPIKGCFILTPKIFRDSRGSFQESYNQKLFNEFAGVNIGFVQDNLSVSTKGVLRGLHFQKGRFSQAKLVQVLQGAIQDVVVDFRPDSDTFGRSFSIILDDVERKQIFIPKGCAHGFLALTDHVIFSYKCDEFYAPEAESGIRYDDPKLNIQWQLPEHELILSGKDKGLKSFQELKTEKVFEWGN